MVLHVEFIYVKLILFVFYHINIFTREGNKYYNMHKTVQYHLTNKLVQYRRKE